MTESCGNPDFYARLPALASFTEATDVRHYVDLPDDWLIVVTDVIGSTKAIQAGAYKNVNTVGVASIAAVCNVDRSVALPFVFGGDGATFAVPTSLVAGVRRALLGAKQLARDGFGLDLRLGVVSVKELRDAGQWVRIAKVRMSPNVVQPAFSGRGWELAEKWVKDAALGPRYAVEPGPGEDGSGADFTGFECRWQGVKNEHGHKLALLVMATSTSAEANMATYKDVLDELQTIYGNVEDYHPLRSELLRLGMGAKSVAPEVTVRTFGQGRVARFAYAIRTLLLNVYGWFIFARKIDTKVIKGSSYKQELVDNSDFRKFDGMLRMVIDGSDDQAAKLEAFLEGGRRDGKLVYGTHRSREALVTCIVQTYNGNHTHFVDGSDGGYALAAKMLKAQLAERAAVKASV